MNISQTSKYLAAVITNRIVINKKYFCPTWHTIYSFYGKLIASGKKINVNAKIGIAKRLPRSREESADAERTNDRNYTHYEDFAYTYTRARASA